MDTLDFSEEEIQEQLEILGYTNIPKHRLLEFKQDLDELIRHGQWKSLPSITQTTSRRQLEHSQPSPPAYTKEKVSRCYFEGSGERFFLHMDKPSSDRQVHTAPESRSHSRQQRYDDSYAQHSVAPSSKLPPGAPNRLQVESDHEDSLDPNRLQVESDHEDSVDPNLSDGYTSFPDNEEQQPFMKRKVLRKQEGESLVYDESAYPDGPDAVGLEGQLEELDLSASSQQDFEENTEVGSDQGVTLDSETYDASLSAFDSYVGRVNRTRSEVIFRPRPKSFIHPVISQQTVKKTDPVNKYLEYKRLWEMFKTPSEADRKTLRWEIKDQLAYNPPRRKQRAVHVPNPYVVPTAKKRSTLRWEVRSDLANHILPEKVNTKFQV